MTWRPVSHMGLGRDKTVEFLEGKAVSGSGKGLPAIIDGGGMEGSRLSSCSRLMCAKSTARRPHVEGREGRSQPLCPVVPSLYTSQPNLHGHRRSASHATWSDALKLRVGLRLKDFKLPGTGRMIRGAVGSGLGRFLPITKRFPCI